jgi:prevent-host-death family protein
MSTSVTIDVAAATLSQLIARVEAGEEIIIARDNTPVVKLVPIQLTKRKRQFGSMRGLITIGPEFFEPLPEEELKGWE